ncbi:MAG: stage II sporulation protein M [Chloroflexota bacterium]
MRENLRMVSIVAWREVRDQFRDWRIIIPIIALTVFFPGLMNFTARQAVNFVEDYGAPVIGERLIPFLLMVVGFFPITVSLVIALESFVGEKERRSIEPLLSSPLTDVQIYLGKLLAAMVPSLFASYLGITVYLISVNLQIGWKPDPVFLIQILLLTTIQAVVMVSGAVVVSSQTTSVRAANLLSSFIIIPVALLIQGESIVMFWAIYSALWWIMLALLLIAGLLIRTGLAHFNREELLGRELDTLNFKWFWQVFKNAFVGQAHSPLEWYRHEIPLALRKLALPVVFTLLILAIGVWMGINQAQVFELPKEVFKPEKLNQGFLEGLSQIRFISAAGVRAIWLQNLRAVALATILGIFSFGVFGMLVVMLPVAFISYITANVAASGISPVIFLLGLVAPHGLLELPAIILSGAAILQVGSTLAAPAHGKTIGEAWLCALANWAKVMLGVVAPLFLLAAVVEVFITPQVAVWLFSR